MHHSTGKGMGGNWMICPECGASRAKAGFLRLGLRRLAARLDPLARRLGRASGRRRSEEVPPSLAELVELVGRDAGMTIFG